MWSPPLEPPEPMGGRVQRERPKPLPKPPPHRPPPVAEPTMLEMWSLDAETSRASYRDAARIEGGGVRVVIRRPPDASLALFHRVGEIVLAVSVSAAVTGVAAAVLDPRMAHLFAVLVFALVAGGSLGALPGPASAIRELYERFALRTGLAGIRPREPRETLIECCNGAELVVTRSPSRARALTSSIALSAGTLETVRAVVGWRRARVVITCDERDVVIAGTLSVNDAHALVARLRQVGAPQPDRVSR